MKRDESGFTLVEMVVTITIEVLIVSALGMAFVGILNGTKSVNQSLSRSGDARIAANYIEADARNSSGPEVSLTAMTCTDASPPVSGTATPIVQFAWSSTSSAGVVTANIVDYLLIGNSITRRVCQGNSTVSVSDRVVASNVQSATAACSPTANCTGTPTSITVTVNEVADSSGNIYTYSLTGSFRKLGGAGAPVSRGPAQSVILLGSGGACPSGIDSINLSGGAHMNVYGKTYINATNGTGCNAVDISNGASFSSGSTAVLNGGTCVGAPQTLCPTMTSYTPAIGDPYASLSAPSTSGMTTFSSSSCSGTIQPGVYTSGISATSGACTLASGIYVLNGPLTAGNGASLTSAAGGVFIYMTNSQFSIGSASAVTLTAMSTGTYSGLLYWQAAADTQQVVIGNGAQIVTLQGALYAPKAQLLVNGGVQPSVNSVVVQTIVVNNGITLTIGSPLTITLPNSMQAWSVGRTYPTLSSSGAGGGGTYTWSATGLPPGLSISSTSGDITGTPTTAGTYSVIVTLNDAAGDTPDTNPYSVTINAAPTITTASPLAGGDTTVAYSRTIASTGGTGTTTWSATGLPAGLSINSSTGVISGTPTATGTSSASVTVTDSTGASDVNPFSITISAVPSITTTSPLAAGEKTAPYSVGLTGSGGTPAYAWSSATLPAGLSIASSTGLISGTPSATGTTSATITLTDAAGGSVSKSLSITIGAQPVISSVTLTNKASGGTVGKMEVGDKITIVYGSTMKVSSFCSAWTTGDAADQTLTGNGVLVNVANSATDVVTVTNSSGCTFNLGSIDLANGAYVTAATTFGGSGGNTSIAWTASSKTLVITLGALASGTVTTGGSTSPIYTASSSVTDSAGAQLGNSPFTLSPAAVRF